MCFFVDGMEWGGDVIGGSDVDDAHGVVFYLQKQKLSESEQILGRPLSADVCYQFRENRPGNNF